MEGSVVVPPLTKLSTEERRTKAIELAKQKLGYKEIGLAIGCSAKTAQQYIKDSIREFKERRIEKAGELLQEELDEIDLELATLSDRERVLTGLLAPPTNPLIIPPSLGTVAKIHQELSRLSQVRLNYLMQRARLLNVIKAEKPEIGTVIQIDTVVVNRPESLLGPDPDIVDAGYLEPIGELGVGHVEASVADEEG